ncbi:MAG: TRAP transporter large permease subunit, partial [Desulfovibrionales bacterium]|nr:TRAP transporter large permease subunit [Desulfovibrionales bacterium]
IYSMILALVYKAMIPKDIIQFFRETIQTTVSVMFIVSAAAIFGWILAAEQVPQTLANNFLAVVENKYIALIYINLFLLLVGCFMETIAAITILTPVLMPITMAMGIDPVHFGIIMILNLMIGLLTPPIGMVLYVLSTVSDVPFEKISKAITPYLILLIIVLYIFTFVPEIVLFLPKLLLG